MTLSTDWLTVSQTAHVLGVSRQRVHQLIRAKILPAERHGPHAYLIPQTAVERRRVERLSPSTDPLTRGR